MNPVTNEGEVYFALFGEDFEPSEVTRLVGLEPSSSRRKGNPIPKHSWWRVIGSKVDGELVDVYEMSSSLVEKLAPYKEGIIRAKQAMNLEAVLEVVLRISTEETVSTPAIGFTPEVIAFLGEVGASIDIDTYRNAP